MFFFLSLFSYLISVLISCVQQKKKPNKSKQNKWRSAGEDSNRRRRWRSTRGRTRMSVRSTAPTVTRDSGSSRIWCNTWGYTRMNGPTAAPTAIRYTAGSPVKTHQGTPKGGGASGSLRPPVKSMMDFYSCSYCDKVDGWIACKKNPSRILQGGGAIDWLRPWSMPQY